MNNLYLALTVVALTVQAEPLKIVCFGDSTTALRQGVTTYCEQLQSIYVDLPLTAAVFPAIQPLLPESDSRATLSA